MFASYFDLVLFAVLPYVALVLFFMGTIFRYRRSAFSYSSLSSQFLENQHHFWGLVPFHYALFVVLAGHVVAFMVPRGVLLWNSQPLRLWILETAALACGLVILISLVALAWRRINDPKLRVVTSATDWILATLLIVQVVLGLWTAIFYPWGSSWFAAAISPYLWSLLWLSPEVANVAPLPWPAKLHIVNAFVLTAFFPFTRLVHQLVFPMPYLWRKPQIVRWYSRSREAP